MQARSVSKHVPRTQASRKPARPVPKLVPYPIPFRTQASRVRTQARSVSNIPVFKPFPYLSPPRAHKPAPKIWFSDWFVYKFCLTHWFLNFSCFLANSVAYTTFLLLLDFGTDIELYFFDHNSLKR